LKLPSRMEWFSIDAAPTYIQTEELYSLIKLEHTELI